MREHIRAVILSHRKRRKTVKKSLVDPAPELNPPLAEPTTATLPAVPTSTQSEPGSVNWLPFIPSSDDLLNLSSDGPDIDITMSNLMEAEVDKDETQVHQIKERDASVPTKRVCDTYNHFSCF